MSAQQPAVKKYIVKLTAEERTRLDVLIQKGKAAARQLLKARILLKADASTAGEAWSDRRICCGAGHQHRHHIAHPSAVGGGRAGCGADPQAFAQLSPKAHLRWRRRGQADCACLLAAAQGSQALDIDAAGDRRGGAEHCRACQRQHDRPDAEKTRSSRISRSSGSFRPRPTPPS